MHIALFHNILWYHLCLRQPGPLPFWGSWPGMQESPHVPLCADWQCCQRCWKCAMRHMESAMHIFLQNKQGWGGSSHDLSTRNVGLPLHLSLMFGYRCHKSFRMGFFEVHPLTFNGCPPLFQHYAGQKVFEVIFGPRLYRMLAAAEPVHHVEIVGPYTTRFIFSQIPFYFFLNFVFSVLNPIFFFFFLPLTIVFLM